MEISVYKNVIAQDQYLINILSLFPVVNNCASYIDWKNI